MAEHWSTLKAALLALLVSGLIWIWAEGESLTTRTLPRVQIEFPRDVAGEYVVRPDDPMWTGVVQIRLEGSVRTVEAALAYISGNIRIPAGLDAVPKGGEERATINLAEAISALPEMSRMRGVIAEVQPPEVLVRVIHMVSRDLPVRVELAREVALDGEPAATPTTVRARLSEPAAAMLTDKPSVLALVSDESLSRLRADGPQTVVAPVRLGVAVPDPDLVSIKPETVTVSLRPKQAVDSVRLPNVPVWFSLPPTEDGAKWNIEVLDKFLTDVTVTGSSEGIKRITKGGLIVKAVVELTTDDLEKGMAEKGSLVKQALFVGVPSDLSCTVTNATVRIKVSKRPNTGPDSSSTGPSAVTPERSPRP